MWNLSMRDPIPRTNGNYRQNFFAHPTGYGGSSSGSSSFNAGHNRNNNSSNSGAGARKSLITVGILTKGSHVNLALNVNLLKGANTVIPHLMM